MSNEIVNITRQVICQKIEIVIKNPRTSYDAAFINPKLRQKLMLRVLNLALPHYVTSADQENGFSRVQQPRFSQQEERQIEAIIQDNIIKILQEEDALKYFQTCEQTSWPQEPSHWFG